MSGTQAEPADARVWQNTSLAAKYVNEVRAALPLGNEQIAMMLRIVNALNPGAARFLDLGCGSGILGAAVLDCFPDTQCVFADFSPPMLATAKAALADFGERATFVEVDYGEPAWTEKVAAQAPFDTIVSGFSIHHQTDDRKKAIYAEIFHLLAPGGVFINNEHVASATPRLETEWNEMLTDALYESALRDGKDTTREKVYAELVNRPDKDANILAPVEDQCTWLRNIGYENVDCYLKVLELAVFGGQRPR
jgi:tRNA (cmo5U34)-methyltransferase